MISQVHKGLVNVTKLKLRRRVPKLCFKTLRRIYASRFISMSSSLVLRRLACAARGQTRYFARPQVVSPSILARLSSTTTTQPKAKNNPEVPPAAAAAAESSTHVLLENNNENSGTATDWSKSYQGLSVEPFPKEISDILQAPVNPLDVEMKPGTFSLEIERGFLAH